MATPSRLFVLAVAFGCVCASIGSASGDFGYSSHGHGGYDGYGGFGGKYDHDGKLGFMYHRGYGNADGYDDMKRVPTYSTAYGYSADGFGPAHVGKFDGYGFRHGYDATYGKYDFDGPHDGKGYGFDGYSYGGHGYDVDGYGSGRFGKFDGYGSGHFGKFGGYGSKLDRYGAVYARRGFDGTFHGMTHGIGGYSVHDGYGGRDNYGYGMVSKDH